jgi:hypothetical protein
MELALPRARTRRRRRPPWIVIIALCGMMLVTLLGLSGVLRDGLVSSGMMAALGLASLVALWPLLFDDSPRRGWMTAAVTLWLLFWPVYIIEVILRLFVTGGW